MPPDKTCQTCGRTIAWRKKWEANWGEVRYCSTRCRKSKPSRIEHQLEEAILSLLARRERTASICPSEAARTIFPENQWRDHMERTRQAARRLVAKGAIEILQNGHPVDPSTAKGPIRLRKTK